MGKTKGTITKKNIKNRPSSKYIVQKKDDFTMYTVYDNDEEANFFEQHEQYWDSRK